MGETCFVVVVVVLVVGGGGYAYTIHTHIFCTIYTASDTSSRGEESDETVVCVFNPLYIYTVCQRGSSCSVLNLSLC